MGGGGGGWGWGVAERQERVTGERYCLVRMPFSFQFRNELVDVLPVCTWYVDWVTAEKMEDS